MDMGAWWDTVHGGHKELDMTERLAHTHAGTQPNWTNSDLRCLKV